MRPDKKAPFLLMALFLIACSGDDDNYQQGDLGQGDTAGDSDVVDEQWQVEIVEEEDTGLFPQIVIQGSTASLAYFGAQGYSNGMVCEEMIGTPTRMHNDLRFLQKSLDGDSWQVSVVDEPPFPSGPIGLSMGLNNQEQLVIAYNGGEPQDQYCGPNNAVLATHVNNSWNFVDVVTESGQAVSGLEDSDSGFVVGLWPSYTVDNFGRQALSYQDVHFGALQHDDRYRADLEFAWENPNWQFYAVDFGEGAGDYSSVVFDVDNTPIISYALPVEAQTVNRLGVWVARLNDGGSWDKVQVHSGNIHQQVASLYDQNTQRLWVAFYSEHDKAVKLRSLQNMDAFTEISAWSSEFVGSNLYDEGRYLAMTQRSDGGLVMAYHRCKRITDSRTTCDQNVEAPVLAIQESTGWTYDEIYTSSQGSCGEHIALTVTEEDQAAVVFRCTVRVGDQFFMRPHFAMKPIGD